MGHRRVNNLPKSDVNSPATGSGMSDCCVFEDELLASDDTPFRHSKALPSEACVGRLSGRDIPHIGKSEPSFERVLPA